MIELIAHGTGTPPIRVWQGDEEGEWHIEHAPAPITAQIQEVLALAADDTSSGYYYPDTRLRALELVKTLLFFEAEITVEPAAAPPEGAVE